MEEKFKRRPNELSLSRVKTIMKSSPDVENVSQESVYLVTKATELFIKYMVEEAYKDNNNSNALEYRHVSELVQTREELAFLREIVPRKCRLRDIEENLRRRGLEMKLPGISSSSSDVSLYSDEESAPSSSEEPMDIKAESSSMSPGTKLGSSVSSSGTSPNPGPSSSRPGPASRTRPSLPKSPLSTDEMSSKEMETSSGVDTSHSSTSSPTNSAHAGRSTVVSRPGTPSTITLSSSSREMSFEGSPSPTSFLAPDPEQEPSVTGPASPMSVVSILSGSRTPSPSPSYSSLSPEVQSAVHAQSEIDMVIIESVSSDSSAFEEGQEQL